MIKTFSILSDFGRLITIFKKIKFICDYGFFPAHQGKQTQKTTCHHRSVLD